ncbi:cysteine desulfurase [Candidatus Peregrinibacteria bacterium CG11_big_fil_rev_8_21_14_0_20_46_8]|nr:MAG: cysteine desulfurase [Candidatus Peregrinibacteria bacterium CG11_big_fil_rev_8_21_14_0_20_46_8]
MQFWTSKYSFVILVAHMRSDFPLLQKQPELVYLDSAATSLKPQPVLDAMNEYYTGFSANIHRGLYDLSERATVAYEGARETVREFINAKQAHEIIFTRGTTEAINGLAQSWGRQFVREGDEILTTVLEHHSNLVPWQMLAREKKCALKHIDVNDDGTLREEQFLKLLSRQTRLLTITHVSNALGTIVPLRKIIQQAHAAGIKVLVDAAQSAPHMPLDVQYLDADFVVFSGHKMCGPTGIGVLYMKERVQEKLELPWHFGGGMIKEVHLKKSTFQKAPNKFEAGTPPIAEAIGLAAAMRYLQSIGMNKIRDHEKQLLHYALKTLGAIDGVQLYGPNNPAMQSGVLSFGIEGIHPHDIAEILNEDNIAVRAGHHCCMPLMERLNLPATVRASFYLYNTEQDIDRLAAGLRNVKKIFKS